MLQITLRNAARVAIVQVLTVVLGILGTAASESWWTFANKTIPPFTYLILHWGFLLLVIPGLWISWAARVLRDPQGPEDTKRIAFLSGVALAAMLLLLMAFSTLNVFGHIAEFDPQGKVDLM